MSVNKMCKIYILHILQRHMLKFGIFIEKHINVE